VEPVAPAAPVAPAGPAPPLLFTAQTTGPTVDPYVNVNVLIGVEPAVLYPVIVTGAVAVQHWRNAESAALIFKLVIVTAQEVVVPAQVAVGLVVPVPATPTQSAATVQPAVLLHRYRAPAVVWHCCRIAPTVFPGVPTHGIDPGLVPVAVSVTFVCWVLLPYVAVRVIVSVAPMTDAATGENVATLACPNIVTLGGSTRSVLPLLSVTVRGAPLPELSSTVHVIVFLKGTVQEKDVMTGV
jgi:hypothetical protein